MRQCENSFITRKIINVSIKRFLNKFFIFLLLIDPFLNEENLVIETQFWKFLSKYFDFFMINLLIEH